MIQDSGTVIRVVTADDHELLREGLKRVLDGYHDIMLVGEAGTGDDLLVLLRNVAADVVLLDISMPGPGFLNVLRSLREEHPAVAVLVLTARPEGDYALRCLQAGAAGYVDKGTIVPELARAIRLAASGDRYVTPALAQMLAGFIAGEPFRVETVPLSPRELEVLRLTAAGRRAKAIGRELGISPKTVSTYRARIREKFRVDSIMEAVRYALRSGLLDEPGYPTQVRAVDTEGPDGGRTDSVAS